MTGVSEESFRQCPTSTLVFSTSPKSCLLARQLNPRGDEVAWSQDACALVSEPLGSDQSAFYEQLFAARGEA